MAEVAHDVVRELRLFLLSPEELTTLEKENAKDELIPVRPPTVSPPAYEEVHNSRPIRTDLLFVFSGVPDRSVLEVPRPEEGDRLGAPTDPPEEGNSPQRPSPLPGPAP